MTVKKYVAEAIGTYALVFAGTGAVLVDGVSGGALGLVGIAMVFGLVVMAMIYAIGDLSGAHINPAVTIAAWVRGVFPAAQVAPYVIAQCAGALAASATLRFHFPEAEGLGATLPSWPASDAVVQSLVFEVILTFFLVFVIFGVTATGKAEVLLAGIAIGGTVGLEVFVGGPISGASMNPARSIGPAVIGGEMQHLWVYLAGPIAGGVLAALVTKYLRCHGEEAGKVIDPNPTEG